MPGNHSTTDKLEDCPGCGERKKLIEVPHDCPMCSGCIIEIHNSQSREGLCPCGKIATQVDDWDDEVCFECFSEMSE